MFGGLAALLGGGNNQEKIMEAVAKATGEVTKKVAEKEVKKFIKKLKNEENNVLIGRMKLNVIKRFIDCGRYLSELKNKKEKNGNWPDFLTEFHECLGVAQANYLIVTAFFAFQTKEEIITYLEECLEKDYFGEEESNHHECIDCKRKRGEKIVSDLEGIKNKLFDEEESFEPPAPPVEEVYPSEVVEDGWQKLK